MKIGILGGTFNPIHYGHLILGEQVRVQLDLDKVIYVPAYCAPHKKCDGSIPAQDRLNMVKLAIEGNPFFTVSDAELKRKGTSYTVDTLREIQSQYPKAELFFICGSDLVNEIPTWKDSDQLFKMARFVLAKRPGYGKRLSGKSFLKIKVAQVDISSSLIRELVSQGRSIKYLTADSVSDYIGKRDLYR